VKAVLECGRTAHCSARPASHARLFVAVVQPARACRHRRRERRPV